MAGYKVTRTAKGLILAIRTKKGIVKFYSSIKYMQRLLDNKVQYCFFNPIDDIKKKEIVVDGIGEDIGRD